MQILNPCRTRDKLQDIPSPKHTTINLAMRKVNGCQGLMLLSYRARCKATIRVLDTIRRSLGSFPCEPHRIVRTILPDSSDSFTRSRWFSASTWLLRGSNSTARFVRHTSSAIFPSTSSRFFWLLFAALSLFRIRRSSASFFRVSVGASGISATEGAQAMP